MRPRAAAGCESKVWTIATGEPGSMARDVLSTSMDAPFEPALPVAPWLVHPQIPTDEGTEVIKPDFVSIVGNENYLHLGINCDNVRPFAYQTVTGWSMNRVNIPRRPAETLLHRVLQLTVLVGSRQRWPSRCPHGRRKKC